MEEATTITYCVSNVDEAIQDHFEHYLGGRPLNQPLPSPFAPPPPDYVDVAGGLL